VPLGVPVCGPILQLSRLTCRYPYHRSSEMSLSALGGSARKTIVRSPELAASAVTSTFVGVTIVAAITTVCDVVLGVLRLATYLRNPFRGLRRLHKPMHGRIAMYRIPTIGRTTRDLPQGADPRAWSWRAPRPRHVQPRT